MALNFLKQIIRNFLYRVYLSGYAESQRKFWLNRETFLKETLSFKDNTSIDLNANIINHRKDRRFIQIGDNCLIRGELMILKHGGEIYIGDDCFLGANSRIWSSKKIIIGNRVLISHNVNIHDNSSHSLNSKERHIEFLHIRKTGELKFDNKISEEEILIEDDVWIGFNATIMKGVRIGKGAIIGSNTIITKNIEEYSVVVGNPARIIKYTK